MFAFFFSFVTSKNPVILLPGLYGSTLHATYAKGYSEHWYCPSKMDDQLFWLDYKFAIPPMYNCLFELLQGYYDEATDTVSSPPGVTISVPDFGGEEGMAYVDQKGIFGHHFIESFASMLNYLKDKGYSIKQDLFGAPYDWRLATSGIEKTFYPQLKELIEHAYDINNGEKVVVLGYSCGGMIAQQFFSKFVTKEWKEKYILKAIFLSPAFAGSMDTVDVAWYRYFPIVKIIKGETIQQTIEKVPCVHALFPNVNVFGDKVLVKGPNGEQYTAKDIPDFLIEHEKFHEENIKFFKKNIKPSLEVPEDPGVPLMMLFNSKIKTRMGMNFKDGYDKDYEIEYEGGDGTVPAIGPMWACNNWGSQKNPLHCVDVAEESEDFDHAGMSTNAAVQDKIYEYITSDLWLQDKSSKLFTLRSIEMYNNNTEYRYTDERPETVQTLRRFD